MKQGAIYIFTGDGKGKTSAALGVAMRAICADLKVAWVAWYKESSWDIAERRLPELVDIDMFFLGEGFYIQESSNQNQGLSKAVKTAALKTGGQVIDKASQKKHQQTAQAALKKAKELVKTDQYDLVVCDEINNAIHDKLVSLNQVKKLLQNRKKTHLVFTGRNASKEVIDLADLVTEMKKVKHPYDQGQPAVRGLDF